MSDYTDEEKEILARAAELSGPVPFDPDVVLASWRAFDAQEKAAHARGEQWP
jgi:hypothetical protein